VVVRLLDAATQHVQLEILYMKKDQEGMDLAKVLLYLLVFLLAG
jgi:hypothetical protein